MSSIGRYEIEGDLGRGGFGKVHRAYDSVMRRSVAIKVLTMGGDAAMLARFRSEAGTTGNLRHNNIITVYDYGEHEGQPYLVMELLQGTSLETAIRGGTPLSLLGKVDILVQIAEGLRYAHEHGVVHRDVKPSNVMLIESGGVKILDFGIAKFKEQGHTRHTTPGLLIGTLEYMAPDQLMGGEADELTDIYSFGVVAYELFSGNQPFRAQSISRTLYLVMNEEPPPLRRLSEEIPEALERIIQTAIAKERPKRYQSLRELLLDLAPIGAALRQARAAELAADAELLAAQGNIEGAQNLVGMALEMDPMQPKGQSLRKEIQRQRERAAAIRKSSELLATGVQRMADGAFEAAIEAFDSAYQALPEDAVERAEIDERRSEARRQRDRENILAEVRGRVRVHLDAGRFVEAAQLVASALKRYPSDGAFLALGEQIEAERVEAGRRADEARREAERLRILEEQRRSEEALREIERLRAIEIQRAEDARREIERLRAIEEQQRAEAARRESERLRAIEEQQRAEAARRESERLRAIEEQQRAEAVRREAERLRTIEEQQRAEVARREAERLRTIEEQQRAEATRREVERLRAIEEQQRAEAVRREAERLRAIEDQQRAEAARREAERLRAIEEQRQSSQSPIPAPAKQGIHVSRTLAIVAAAVAAFAVWAAIWLSTPPAHVVPLAKQTAEQHPAPTVSAPLSNVTPSPDKSAVAIRGREADAPAVVPAPKREPKKSTEKAQAQGTQTAPTGGNRAGAVAIPPQSQPAAPQNAAAQQPAGGAANVPNATPLTGGPPAGIQQAATDPQAKDRQAVLDALTAFSHAIQNKDANSIHALWPGISPTQLAKYQSDFRDLRSYTVEFHKINVELSNGLARVESETTTRKDFGDAPYSSVATWRITLQKQGGTWQIASVR